MKGFLIFLAVTFLIIGAIGYYEMQHPDEIKVRKDGQWVTIKRDALPKPTEKSGGE
jgi:hypothetical protein